MRVLFLIQGEGRGHLTQALSLAQILQMAGHDVIGAIVGITAQRTVPTFFSEQFSAPISPVFSPGLVYNAGTNALEPFKTTVQAIQSMRPFWRSLKQVRDHIDTQRPDVVVNFYEMLGGMTYALLRPSVPMICIAHQYMAFHPDFQRPKGQWFYRQAFKFNTLLTCFGAQELLALSFDKQANEPQKRLRVVPPLLRREVTELKPKTAGTDASKEFLLAYVTQPGLKVELEKAHQQRPDVRMDAFHSDASGPDQLIDDTLTYHAIDGKRFLEFMARCKAIVTTAGFESVCEALYLGKPALMIPQPNHYEQACNAIDSQRAGVGIASDRFDLNQLLDYIPRYDPQVSERFRAWHAQGYFLFLAALNRAVTPTSKPSSGGFLSTRVRHLLRS
ncbi:glycosyltransferase family protein [Spirosoma radiotolerans]|uniref:Glycosyl transferase n=1 Tax=Spirosoma radiotolerans TaxID=1379870 RepID=A0A0E3ZZ21_9BACT|nr:glycosyltransferase family protein [Spirosoma radiotolerans]AKD57785.1 glycosyl transferase [Spirosoma radiotolerans]